MQRKRDHPTTASSECAELQRGEDVVTLEVGVVGEHLLNRHPPGQQLQQGLNRVPRASYRWLTMAKSPGQT